MAKRFSIVRIGDESIFLRGYAEATDLGQSEVFLETLATYSSFEKVNVEIEHCLLLDFPGRDVDISIEDLEELVDNFEVLMDENHLYSEEILSFEILGIKEDEYIET